MGVVKTNRGASDAAPTAGNSRPITLRMRVFGRVCFVGENPVEGSLSRFERMQVVGVRMDTNAALGFDPHFLTLAAALPSIKSYSRRPDLTSFTNHLRPADIDELYIWNLAQCEVTVAGLAEGEVTIDEDSAGHRFASLEGLVPAGQAVIAESVGKSLTQSAADFVMRLESGTLRPMSPLGARLIDYFPFDESRPKAALDRRHVADGAEITLPAKGSEITFHVHRRSDNVKWSITIERDNIVQTDPIVTLGNTCGCAVNSTVVERDKEFAAYYDLLASPVKSGDRLIPVTVNANVSTPTCDVGAVLRQTSE